MKVRRREDGAEQRRRRPLKAGAGRRRGCRAALRRAGIFVRLSARRRAARTPPFRRARRGRGHRRSSRRDGSLRADAPPPARRAGPVRARESTIRSATPRRAGRRAPRSSTILRCAPRGRAANRSGARRRRSATARRRPRQRARVDGALAVDQAPRAAPARNSSRNGLAQRSCSSMAIEPSASCTSPLRLVDLRRQADRLEHDRACRARGTAPPSSGARLRLGIRLWKCVGGGVLQPASTARRSERQPRRGARRRRSVRHPAGSGASRMACSAGGHRRVGRLAAQQRLPDAVADSRRERAAPATCAAARAACPRGCAAPARSDR